MRQKADFHTSLAILATEVDTYRFCAILVNYEVPLDQLFQFLNGLALHIKSATKQFDFILAGILSQRAYTIWAYLSLWEHIFAVG